jgi:rubrerythrin
MANNVNAIYGANEKGETMDNKCMNCTETCPQTERIQNAALGRMYAMKKLVPILKKIESGELAPVVHGRWKPVDHDGSWRVDMCSICQRRIHYVDYDQPYQYCPNCGAKMDGDGNG